MKSLSVRPSILCVQTVTSTLPQPKLMSGWCPCSSASSPTLLTKPKASRKFLNRKTLLRWCSSTISHSGTCRLSGPSSSPLSGGVPPFHGTHVFLASLVILYLLVETNFREVACVVALARRGDVLLVQLHGVLDVLLGLLGTDDIPYLHFFSFQVLVLREELF